MSLGALRKIRVKEGAVLVLPDHVLRSASQLRDLDIDENAVFVVYDDADFTPADVERVVAAAVAGRRTDEQQEG